MTAREAHRDQARPSVRTMGRDGLSVVEKVVLILDRFLAERTASLSFNQIVTGTGLNRATAHRLLADLAEHGVLAQDVQRDEYRLGPVATSVGALAQEVTLVSERSLPRMRALRDAFGETLVLAELVVDAAVPIRRVDGVHEMRMNQEVGRRYPAYAGATGKVLLAHLDHEALEAYLSTVRFEPLTAATVNDLDELQCDLDRIRRAGVAVSRGERVAGAAAASAPVFDGHGRALWALTISGVASRLDGDRMFAAAIAVKAAAQAVSRDLGHRPADTAPTAEDLEDAASEPRRLLVELVKRGWPREGGPTTGAREPSR